MKSLLPWAGVSAGRILDSLMGFRVFEVFRQATLMQGLAVSIIYVLGGSELTTGEILLQS